jgi:hypothetical protein
MPMILTSLICFVALAVQKALPSTLRVKAAIAVDPIKLTDQPIDEAAMD